MEITNNKVNSALWSEKYWTTCSTYTFKYNENASVVFEVAMKPNEKVSLHHGVDNVLTSRFPHYLGLFLSHDLHKQMQHWETVCLHGHFDFNTQLDTFKLDNRQKEPGMCIWFKDTFNSFKNVIHVLSIESPFSLKLDIVAMGTLFNTCTCMWLFTHSPSKRILLK